MANASDGRFVWYDLLTSDVKAASAFYGEVVGWKTQPWEDSHYTLLVGSQGPLGGVMALPDEAKKMGAPPHWMSNVQVANVDETVAQAKKAGAKIHREASDIPKVGRFAVIADPQGASVSVFTPQQPMPAHDDTKQGEFSWNELLTSDHESAFRFYSELFGWKRFEEHDMGPMGKYLIYGVGDKRLGGMFTKGKDMPMPPSWIYYIHVDDVDAAVGRAKSKGAKVMNGPMDVPGGDRIAQLSDPQGVFFAMHSSAKKK